MPCWRFQALYKIREPFTILPFLPSVRCQYKDPYWQSKHCYAIVSISVNLPLTLVPKCSLSFRNCKGFLGWCVHCHIKSWIPLCCFYQQTDRLELLYYCLVCMYFCSLVLFKIFVRVLFKYDFIFKQIYRPTNAILTSAKILLASHHNLYITTCMYDYISCYVMRLDPPRRLMSNKGMLTLCFCWWMAPQWLTACSRD